MKRPVLLTVAAALLYVSVGSAQQYPILDQFANKVIAKYQNSTCEQLWQKKSAKTPPSPEQQKVSQLLKGDPQMRQVASPAVSGQTKILSCV